MHLTELVAALDTPTVISLVALFTSTLISSGALVLAWLSYRRSGPADQRDKQRTDIALAADAAKKSAELVVVSQERITRRTGEPTISVTNVGVAIARNVRAWLARRSYSSFSASIRHTSQQRSTATESPKWSLSPTSCRAAPSSRLLLLARRSTSSSE